MKKIEISKLKFLLSKIIIPEENWAKRIQQKNSRFNQKTWFQIAKVFACLWMGVKWN